jgi:hypothetical protein
VNATLSSNLVLLTKFQASWQPLVCQAQGPPLIIDDPAKSVKLATFPDAPPLLKTDYQYMDIWEPHRKPPTSTATCAIWGSWEDQATEPPVWNMLVTAGMERVVLEFRNFLEKLLLRPSGVPNSLPEPLSSFSHWTTVIGGIFIPEIHLGRLHVREAAKELERLVCHSRSECCILHSDRFSLHRDIKMQRGLAKATLTQP